VGVVPDIALVSLGTTPGLRRADEAFAGLARAAGVSCEVVPVRVGGAGRLRRQASATDLVEALAARRATRGVQARAVVYSADDAEGDVSVAVYPWEISLARMPPEDSALNHVRGEIASIVRVGNRVRVRVGPLTAEITAASADRLGLAAGQHVVATFKATATRVLRG